MAKRSPRAIGTTAESAVVRWLQDDGWPDAERLPLYGAKDRGDLVVCRQPLCIAEVKAGQAADVASEAVLDEWMAQADTERLNAGAVLCPLVVRKHRRNTAKWDVYLPLRDVVWLDMGIYGGSRIPVRMALAYFSDLLRKAVERQP